MKDLRVLLQSGLARREAAKDILEVNRFTAGTGLVFTAGQAAALVVSRDRALMGSGRIELGGGIVKRMILAFYDSPYFLKEEAVETLDALMTLFYQMKNETFDTVGDDELIGFLRERFDGECRGSVEKLQDAAFDAMARLAHGAPVDAAAEEAEGEEDWDD